MILQQFHLLRIWQHFLNCPFKSCCENQKSQETLLTDLGDPHPDEITLTAGITMTSAESTELSKV